MIHFILSRAKIENVITATEYPHIVLEDGCPKIEGCRMKVHQLATAHVHHGWSPHELHWQYPHLPLAAIYAGLAYYYDHRVELDAQAEESSMIIEEMGRKISNAGPSRQTLQERAREHGWQCGVEKSA